MRGALLLALAVVWLTLVTRTARCEDKPEATEKPSNVKIKIVDSPAARIAPLQSLNDKKLTLRIKPANISGPPHLQLLAGHCFELMEKGYEYKVCPFSNVTQKEVRVAWNSFHGVLGVWREWLVENDTFVGMHYVMGQECSVGEREVKVMFNCSTMTRLHSTSEPSTCHYIIWMDTPLACFKGAMQVYHVLSPDQLKEWEQYDYEYHADEITFQGLTKRRRKVLIWAGLLIDIERERERLAEEKRRKEEEEQRAREQREKELLANPLFKSPLTTCEQERDQLKKDLDELNGKLRGIIKDYPAVAYRLGFLQNFTHHVTDHMTDHVTETHGVGGKEEVVVDSDRSVEPVAAVLDRGMREAETEFERGGFGGGVADLDEPEDEDKDQLTDILKEINDKAERRDKMEFDKEMVELHKQDHWEKQQGRAGTKEAIAAELKDTEQETETDKDLHART